MSISRTLSRFRKAEIGMRAAALAYHSILGLVPVIGILFIYLHKIGITRQWAEMTRAFILSNLNVSASQEFIAQLEGITSKLKIKSIGEIAVLIFIWTAYNLILKLGNSLDMIFASATEFEDRSVALWWLYARRALVLMGLPVALTLSLVVTTWIKHDSWLRFLFKLESVGTLLALPVSWAVDILAIFSVYAFIARRRIPYFEAFRAALLVAPIFETAKFLVGLYNRYAFTTQKVYGAFAAVPLFIIWVQLAWIILLTGALFVRVPHQHPPQQPATA